MSGNKTNIHNLITYHQLVSFQLSVTEIKTKLDIISHEHQAIMSMLQTLTGPKPSSIDDKLVQDMTQTLKYLKEKLDLPGGKQMLKGIYIPYSQLQQQAEAVIIFNFATFIDFVYGKGSVAIVGTRHNLKNSNCKLRLFNLEPNWGGGDG